jgi:2-polyprenyl-3-methyl-5-hydroxy-6-metoxy-1,4-benzoquinol methylase
MSALKSIAPMEQRAARYRSCNLCGSDERKLKYEIDGYHIVECAACKLCYVAEQVTDDEILVFYGRDYYTGGNDKGYSDYVGNRDARKAHFRSLLPDIRRYLRGERIKALDIGCAAGFFLEVAQEAGWRAKGIEISTYMSEYARQSLGLDVLTGRLEELDLPERAFDLVTMWDVIEHLSDPFSALQRARRLLAPDGLIAIATGDISGATARIYGRRWSLLAPPGHLFYFSRRTLFAMLRQTGFEPLSWKSDGAFLLDGEIEAGSGSAIYPVISAVLQQRLVNAGLRRLKLGSVMTVYARRCGTN